MRSHRPWRLAMGLLLGTLAVGLACGGADATPTSPQGPGESVSLPDMITAPHFIDAYPLQGDVLAQAPPRVVLNFNFNLNQDSTITVTRDGKPVEVGPVVISDEALSMDAALKNDTGDGVYEVGYTACWPDGSCHDGRVAFTVDGATLAGYEDLRGRDELTIRMVDERRFDPPRIIISPGTRVTWLNGDLVAHFVNADPHPSHNVLPGLNSLAINPRESYSYTFTEPGAWGYHCSAHFNLGMVAQVVIK